MSVLIFRLAAAIAGATLLSLPITPPPATALVVYTPA